MRRLFVIAAALGLMLAVKAAYGDADADHGTALAAIGFVVLAAFTVGDLLNAIGLPRITGYILSGVVLGPELAAVLSRPVVADMGVFNTLALGLIALTAGLELELAALGRVLRTMLATILGKAVLLLLVVGGGLYLVHLYVQPLPVGDDHHALVLAALIAVLGIGTSPSVTLAIVNDSGARGRLTDLALGSAVLKDVVVVIALAITIALGRAYIAPEAGGIQPVIMHMVRELGLSIALGAMVGGLLILYVKYVHRELLLGAVCTVLVTAEVTAYLHLELLLVFIAAGFVVRNASRQEHHLLPALGRVSLPVFVVFFTTAGAKIELASTLSVLPIAGGVAAARVVVYYLASRFGAWVGREGRAVRSSAWLAYIPQAGVTLGLVLLASQALPQLAEPILRLGLAIVAINLLVGPVALGLALGRAGEIPGRAARAAEPAADAAEETTEAAADRAGPRAATKPDEEPRRRAPTAAELLAVEPEGPARELPALSDTRLRAARDQLADDLEEWTAQLLEQVIRPLADRGKRAIARLVTEQRQHDNPAAAVRTMLSSAPDDAAVELEAQLRAAHADIRLRAERLPELIVVATELRLLRGSRGDGLFTRLKKVRQRIAHAIRLVPKRSVPVRLAARVSTEAALAEALAPIVLAWFRTRSDMLRDLSQLATGERGVDETQQAILTRGTQFVDQSAARLRRTVGDSVDRFHEHLASLGAPSAPPSRLSLFEIEQRVERSLEAVDQGAVRGRALIRARMGTLHGDALYGYFASSLEEEFERMVRRPLALVSDEILPLVKEVLERLPASDGEHDLDRLLAAVDAALDERTLARLSGLQMKYYRATQGVRLLSQLAARLDGVPDKLVVLNRQADEARLASGRDLPLVSLEPARRLEEELIEGFAPEIADAIKPVGDLVSAVDSRVQQAVSVASYGVGLARGGSGGDEVAGQAAREALARARKMLEALVEELGQATGPALARGRAVVTDTCHRIEVALGKAPPDPSKARAGKGRRRWLAAARDRVVRGGLRLRRWRTWAMRRGEALVRAVLRRPEVRDWILRGGGERLDAVAMRARLVRDHAAPDVLGLPAVYAELLSPDAVDDYRLAIAHRRDLDKLVAVLQPGKNEDFTSVLITGERGSGRTSMINMVGHRLARRRVVRLDARYHDRHGGPLAAVALELGCPAEAGAIAAALRRSATILLVDDLERFLHPSAAGIDDLDAFLRLVRQTASYTHWVVTAQTASVALFDPLIQLRQTFGRRVHLASLDAEELDRVIETRIHVSGLDVVCADGSRRTRLRPKEARQRYFRSLARITGGNLRRALLIHARSTAVQPSGSLVASQPNAPGVPFLRHLGAGPLAALALITRYVELTREDLAAGLGVAAAEVDGVLLPLESAGLVRAAIGGASLAIPPTVVDAICQQLADLEIRSGDAA